MYVEITVEKYNLAAMIGVVTGDAEQEMPEVVGAAGDLFGETAVVEGGGALDEALAHGAEALEFELPGRFGDFNDGSPAETVGGFVRGKRATGKGVHGRFVPGAHVLHEFPNGVIGDGGASAGLGGFKAVEDLEDSGAVPAFMEDRAAELTGDAN